MGRKIAIICGSPRKKGNTNRVVGWVAEAAREAGAEVEIIDAPRLSYKTLGCTGCMACQQSEEYRCVIDDDASPILARLPESDIVVLASPVYWFGPTAQLKVFADRMFSLIKFVDDEPVTPLAGKTLGVIATAGGEREHGLGLLEQTYQIAAGLMGLPFESLLVPHAPMRLEQPDEVAAIQKQAEAFGRKLAGA